MPDRSRKRPRDPNQLAKLIVDIATGEVEDPPEDDGRNPYPRTPAMAAGVADHIWTLQEISGLLD
jgi:hypothetical protein